jgi:hypothetical protein
VLQLQAVVQVQMDLHLGQMVVQDLPLVAEVQVDALKTILTGLVGTVEMDK